MPTHRYLSNAPISEALIDVRVKARPSFRSQEFEALREPLAAAFPTVEEHRGLRATFAVTGAERSQSVEDLGLQGYFFHSADRLNIAQFRVDGFTFNRLRPYTRWTELLPVALDLWRHYREIAQPEVVIRLAVRYINRIHLPEGPCDLNDYLTEPPDIPDGLPQDISNFFTRVTIEHHANQMSAHVTQTLEAIPGQPSVILDIDTFRWTQLEPNSPEVGSVLGHLRDFKNQIFFSYVTEHTLQRYV